MSIAKFSPRRTAVSFKGGTFNVRGLNLDDLAALLDGPLAASPLPAVLAGAASVDEGTVLRHLVTDGPEVVAHLIALAADEPEAVEQAARLPLPVQFEAIKVIMHLTCEDAGGAVPFFQKMAELLRELPRHLPTVPTS